MGFIYKITNNVNGKIYVGKTELPDPTQRWKEHLKDYDRKRCEKRPLYEAMNKYGTEHFHFEIIEETDKTEEREKYWINELHTYVGFKDCNGYNATLGGDGKSYLNLDEDEVIQYHAWEASFIARDTAKHFGVDTGTIKKILKKNNVFWFSNKAISQMYGFLQHGSVNQIDIKTKQIINQFKNAQEASDELGFGKGTIIDSCNNRNGHHYSNGYAWYYQKDMKKAIENGDFVDYFEEYK